MRTGVARAYRTSRGPFRPDTGPCQCVAEVAAVQDSDFGERPPTPKGNRIALTVLGPTGAVGLRKKKSTPRAKGQHSSGNTRLRVWLVHTRVSISLRRDPSSLSRDLAPILCDVALRHRYLRLNCIVIDRVRSCHSPIALKECMWCACCILFRRAG